MLQGEVDNMFVDLPFWMETPRGWDDWSFLEQRQHVEYWTGVRKRRQRLERSIAREYMRLEKLQQVSLEAWKERNRRAQLASYEAELQFMLAEEVMKVRSTSTCTGGSSPPLCNTCAPHLLC
jgi:hypothetical protein